MPHAQLLRQRIDLGVVRAELLGAGEGLPGAGQIGRVGPDGRIEEYPLPDRSCRPHAVAATPDGGCWATLWAASSVVRLDRDGGLAEEIRFRPGSEPHAIAIGPDGSVWVALEAGSLAHLTPDPLPSL